MLVSDIVPEWTEDRRYSRNNGKAGSSFVWVFSLIVEKVRDTAQKNYFNSTYLTIDHLPEIQNLIARFRDSRNAVQYPISDFRPATHPTFRIR